ncbi:MAG: hypothetical protein WA864_00550 [Acetobacteraceae bacterium]
MTLGILDPKDGGKFKPTPKSSPRYSGANTALATAAGHATLHGRAVAVAQRDDVTGVVTVIGTVKPRLTGGVVKPASNIVARNATK